MKKTRVSLIVLATLSAGLLLAATSCKRGGDESVSPANGSAFTATTEGHAGDGKTHLDVEGDNAVKWDLGDEIVVYNGGDASHKFTANTDNSVMTGFNMVGGDDDEFYLTTPFTAFYPSNLVNSKGVNAESYGVTLPTIQTYKANGFDKGSNPMMAHSENTNLAFKNVCGLLQLQLTGVGKVKEIVVESLNGEILSGTGALQWNNGLPKLEMNAGGNTSVKLDCSHETDGGVLLSESTAIPFYIVVPAGKLDKPFRVTVTSDGGYDNKLLVGEYSGANTDDHRIQRSRIRPMTETSVVCPPEGALPGRFSVSSDKQVWFSKGNLYYDETTEQWNFEDNQYDFRTYYGNTNTDTQNEDACIGGEMCSTPNGQWGLFGWSAKSIEGTPYVAGNVYGRSTSTEGSDYGQLKTDVLRDWGENLITNGGVQGVWNTLEFGEFDYLINKRAGARYASAMVCGVNGGLFFPDGVSESNGKATVGGVTINYVNGATGAAFTANEINATQWSSLEAAGVVFLPCIGERYGTMVNNVNNGGSYWSSTIATSVSPNYIHRMNINGSQIGVGSNTRCYGCGVRLVCP